MLSREQVREIGVEEGLGGIQLEVFTDYIIAREFAEGPIYVREWAQRFSSGKEWDCSDKEGKQILAERFGYVRVSPKE